MWTSDERSGLGGFRINELNEGQALVAFILIPILIPVSILVLVFIVILVAIIIILAFVITLRLKTFASDSHAVNAFGLVDGSGFEAFLETQAGNVRKPRRPQRRNCSQGSFVPAGAFGNHHRNRDHQLIRLVL